MRKILLQKTIYKGIKTPQYNEKMKKYPSIDLGKCNKCMGCIEVAPTVFHYNKSFGFIEVAELDEYPLEDIEEAIKNCPVDCIIWEGDGE